jgi:tight adherence protein C
VPDPQSLQTLLMGAAALLIGAPAAYAAALGLHQAHLAGLRRRRLSPEAVPTAAAPRAATRAAKGRLSDELRRLGQRLAVSDPGKLSVIRLQLIQAGYFNREAVTFYLAGRFTALVAAAVGALVLLPWAIAGGGGLGATLLAGLLATAALLGPDRVVAARRSAKMVEYREGFPDLLDLLVASVEAGLSLDAAVNRVGDELSRRYPTLAEHLRFLTLELRAGKDRKEAWQSFAERLGLEEARAFATMLRQAEEMGTSLGETLRVFSEDMRAKRMLRAEEKAMALSAKLIVPLILFIFPCLLGVLMLPAIFRAIQATSGG